MKSKFIEALQSHPAFEKASEQFLIKLSNSCELIKLKNGQILFSKGDVASGGYIVVDGLIRLFLENSKDTKTIRLVAPRGSFADPMMYGVAYFPVSAESIGESTLIFIPSSVVLNEIRSNPDVAIGMLMTLSVRLKQHVDTVQMLSVSDPALRLIMYLQESDKKLSGNWLELKMVLSRKDLAARLNLAPETTSRIVSKFLKLNIINVKNHKIVAYREDKINWYLDSLKEKS